MRSKAAVSYSRSGHTSGVSWNLGSLLLDFFHLYGVSFNYQQLGISIRDGGSYFAKTERVWSNPGRQSILCIENPDQPDIDMGKNSFLMFKVKKAFEHGHQVLLVALLKCNKLNKQKSLSASASAGGLDGNGEGESEVSAGGDGGVASVNEASILAHLIRSDDEMLQHRLEEKKELLREWEAIQKRKRERHGHGHSSKDEGGRGKRKKAKLEKEGEAGQASE
jgi:DNA polymerase sigma